MTDLEVVSEEQFVELVEAVQSDGFSAIALFTAPTWCIPCRRFEPHWTAAQDVLTEYTFVKVDMGEAREDTGRHWATALYNILGVPSVKLFVPGLEVINIKSRTVVPFVKEVREYAKHV